MGWSVSPFLPSSCNRKSASSTKVFLMGGFWWLGFFNGILLHVDLCLSLVGLMRWGIGFEDEILGALIKSRTVFRLVG